MSSLLNSNNVFPATFLQMPFQFLPHKSSCTAFYKTILKFSATSKSYGQYNRLTINKQSLLWQPQNSTYPLVLSGLWVCAAGIVYGFESWIDDNETKISCRNKNSCGKSVITMPTTYPGFSPLLKWRRARRNLRQGCQNAPRIV